MAKQMADHFANDLRKPVVFIVVAFACLLIITSTSQRFGDLLRLILPLQRLFRDCQDQLSVAPHDVRVGALQSNADQYLDIG
jgi:hypothetical protein